MKAAIYSRKSKFTGKGESIENQIEMCKKYAADNNYNETFIYEDEGFSGKNTNRPEFIQMIKDAKVHKFDAIICYRLDRISRNVSDFSSLVDELKSLNIDFISIREQFDTTNPMGTAMMFISSVFAQLERETIAERISDNMYELAKTGRWLGGTPPYGFISEPCYYLDTNGKQKKMVKLSSVDNESKLVKSFFEDYLKLGSLGRLQKHLIKNNISTKRKVAWDIKSLQLLLRNPVYVKSSQLVINYLESKGATVFGYPNGCGILIYNKKDPKDKYRNINEWILSVAKHEGIIEDTLWLNVQNQLDRNKNLAPRLVNNDASGIFNSILYCKKCGSRMIQKQGHISKKTGKKFRYYVCLNKINSRGELCNCKNVRADKLEHDVLEKLFEETSDNSSLINAIKNHKKKLQSEISSKNDVNSIKKLISQKQLQVDNLIEKISLNPNLYDLFEKKLEELNNDLKQLKFKKFDLEDSSANMKIAIKEINSYTKMLLNFKQLFDHADHSMKKLLIGTLIDKIYYDAESKSASIKLFCSKKGAL